MSSSLLFDQMVDALAERVSETVISRLQGNGAWRKSGDGTLVRTKTAPLLGEVVANMSLAEFLDSENLSDAAFAKLIGITRQAVHRYRRGDRIPDPKTMAKIVKATKGAVTPNDFYEQRASA